MAHTGGVPLPTTKQLRDLLESQLDREVRLQPSDPPETASRGLSYAIYVDAHLATHAVAVADLPLAAYLSAAAGLVPVGIATAAVREGGLPTMLAERFEEVQRGWTSLFAPPGGDRIRLYSTVLAGQRPPSDVVALAAAAGRRLDLTVSVRAYGEGHLSVVMGR